LSSTALSLSAGVALRVNAVQVVSARRTGWGVPSGTAARAAFATFAAPAVSSAPTQSEVQAIGDHVQVLSERLKAMVDDLTAHGLIGA
jgi:hypothetical protein